MDTRVYVLQLYSGFATGSMTTNHWLERLKSADAASEVLISGQAFSNETLAINVRVVGEEGYPDSPKA